MQANSLLQVVRHGERRKAYTSTLFVTKKEADWLVH